MFFTAYAFKGQVHVFAGRVKKSCRTSAISKYFCPLILLFFERLKMENSQRDLLSQWSIEQTPVCFDCLENIVMNEKWDSEHQDNLGKLKWHEDKVGTLNVLCFTFLISFLMRKLWRQDLFNMLTSFPVDSHKICA